RSYGDWSSDVCSSDLATPGDQLNLLQIEAGGGESDGDQRQNRPPGYVGVFVASGDLERAMPTIFPRSVGPSAPVRDGLANRKQKIGRASCRERGWSRA